MIVRLLLILTISLCHHALFAYSDHPTEPRKYFAPPSVPQTDYMSTLHIPTYRLKFKNRTPDWVTETIENELSFFQNHPISQQALNATFARISSHGFPRTHYLRRYRIIGEKIYAYGVVGETESDLILRTVARLSDFPGVPNLPNVDFMINHNDGMPMDYDPPEFWITKNEADQAPVFSGGKRADAPYIVVIPHRMYMPSWNELMRATYAARCPWNQKIRGACWRGNIVLDVPILSSTDQELLDACTRAPRYLISALSVRYPDLINAGFTPSLEWIPSQTLRNLVRPLVKGYLSTPEHVRYAYLPILDGAMISGAGYEWRLLSNSLVFKPDSPNIAWFERGVKPYVHYVPIHSNMDDLIEKIYWSRAHDAECEQIANNGASFALTNLTTEGLYFFIFRLLQEYEKCQTFNTADLFQECELDQNWTRIR